MLKLDPRIAVCGAGMAIDLVDIRAGDGSLGFVLVGESAYDLSGRSVASAGDVNGDGFDDLIVGAAYGNGPDGRLNAGDSYVVFGKAGGFGATIDLAAVTAGDGSLGFVLQGETADDRSGFSVASAGDVNGDGLDDLIVGALYADGPADGRSRAGDSYVIFGKAGGIGATIDLAAIATGDGSLGFVLRGESAYDLSGASVASAGDVNGDGFDDVIVGAPFADGPADGRLYAGDSYVIFGKAGGFDATIDLAAITAGDGSLGFVLQGERADDRSGRSVASAGDVNGDGFDDLIVGAYRADGPADGRPYAGDSYVIFGKAGGFGATIDLASITAGDGSLGFVVHGVTNDVSGFSVASAGDVNGDGFADLIVGAPYGDGPADGRATAGESYVVFGTAGGFGAAVDLAAIAAGDGSLGFVLHGETEGDTSGRSVASAGDVNGDGFDDLIVGAPYADGPADVRPFGGEIYVIFGKAGGFGATLDLAAIAAGTGGFVIHGEVTFDSSGRSVASAGDINGDGFDDLIVGSRSAGDSYVIFGSATIGSSSDEVTHPGTAGPDALDGNGDANVMVGGQGDDILNGNGGADVFHGGEGDDRLAVADLTFELADGGGNTDTLALAGAGLTLDLTNRLVAARVQGIERIDLTGSGDNTVEIDLLGVRTGLGEATGGTHVLRILGDVGDTVLLADPRWGKTGSFSDGGTTFDRYVFANGIVDVEQGVSVPGATIEGSSGNDTIGLSRTVAGQPFATNRDDVINGNDGDDSINGAGGADAMTGGDGDDTYWVDDALDVVLEVADQGYDTVRSTIAYSLGEHVENLTLLGGGAIAGTGNALANTIVGNGAGNVLAGLGGADALDGGGGKDTASYAAASAGVTVSLAAGTGSGGDAQGDTLVRIENLTGSSFDDTLTGDGLGNVLSGGDGNDALSGGVRNDTLQGGDGNDTLDGGVGADSMAGGDGDDTYIVDTVRDVVTEIDGEGSDTIQSEVSFTMADGSNVENLTLIGIRDVSGTGNALANELTGNDASNALSGGAGEDRLAGGESRDTLTGGADADTFVFAAPSDGIDRILDFVSGEDMLEISALGFGGNLVAGSPPTVVMATGASTAVGGADGYFILDDDGPNLGSLYWDATGGSGDDAVQVAILTSVTSLAASDFNVI
jgi:Ca2+-binding RTX toxin-like protein